jgi:2-polyprenyl-3-methyl-5-hydroxy-6-metoxy-1,4-benzoquinol methylase
MWNQIVDCENESFRDAWVHKTLSTLRTSENQSLLDVGAGLQPYRKYAEEIGFRYKAHDFSMYRPESELAGGLQNSSWHYPAADFNCDILNIPSNSKYEIVICTEVLEHVPDPVAAFDKMVSLLAPDGLLVVTVPLMSLMHQAPYWFQSGLSPQWFEYHSKQRQIEIKELSIYGDYADYLEQEILRAFGFFSKIRRFPRGRKHLKRFFRKKLSSNLLESAGFGVVFIGQNRQL